MGARHYNYIDVAKGIGILLVIAGHTMFPFHAAINIFHMPLFFVIAGITFTTPNVFSIFLIKKIDRIGIPYIFFTIVSSVAAVFLKKISAGDFNGPLWFLPTIFIALCIYAILRKSLTINQIHITIILFSIISYICAKYPQTDILPFHLSRAFAATVFIHIGHLLRGGEFIITTSSKKIVLSIVTFIVYGISMYILHSNYDISGIFMQGTIYANNYFLFYTASISAIILTLFISSIINDNKILQWLGQNSLIIMCTHFPLIERLNIIASRQPLYDYTYGKIILVTIIYAITLGFSTGCIFICKKFIPRLTGYKPLITVK